MKKSRVCNNYLYKFKFHTIKICLSIYTNINVYNLPTISSVIAAACMRHSCVSTLIFVAYMGKHAWIKSWSTRTFIYLTLGMWTFGWSLDHNLVAQPCRSTHIGPVNCFCTPVHQGEGQHVEGGLWLIVLLLPRYQQDAGALAVLGRKETSYQWSDVDHLPTDHAHHIATIVV